MENRVMHGDHYKIANNMAEDLKRTLLYEIERAGASWADYTDSEPDAAAILFPN
jgi:hypothetical protein